MAGLKRKAHIEGLGSNLVETAFFEAAARVKMLSGDRLPLVRISEAELPRPTDRQKIMRHHVVGTFQTNQLAADCLLNAHVLQLSGTQTAAQILNTQGEETGFINKL